MADKPKILIIRNDHIGDMVLATQVFREIRRSVPDVELWALASPINGHIIEKDRNIDKILEIEMPSSKPLTLLNYLIMALKLRKEKFDYGIDLRGSKLNAWLMKTAGIKNRMSRTDWHPEIAKLLTNSIIPKKGHIIKQNLDIVNKGLNIKAKDYWPEIAVSKEDRKEVESFFRKNKLKSYICICPGTSFELQRWKTENFEELIRYIVKNYPQYKMLLIGGKKDKIIISKLMISDRCLSLIGFNLRALSLIFRKSRCVIALDGGPMHIAWVSGAKTIALLGPLDMNLLRPLKNSLILYHKLPCNPCSKKLKDCPMKDGERCMDLISVSEVISAIDRIL